MSDEAVDKSGSEVRDEDLKLVVGGAALDPLPSIPAPPAPPIPIPYPNVGRPKAIE